MRKKIPVSLFGCLVFFALLWLLDFPKPYLDDLFYIGAGLNMANGGDFSNPFLSRQFSEHFFFVYPPFHSYVLAGWLKIFGISSASLTGFQMLMYLLCAGSAIFILRRHRAPAWLEWLIPLVTTNAFLTHGLRPEPLGAAFVMVGFAMIECGVRNRLLVFCAFFLMLLGGGTAPRMILYAAALILIALWRLCGPSLKGSRERRVPPGLLMGAWALSAIIFSAMIHFKFKEFWEALHQHSQRVVSDDLVTFILKHLSCKEEILWLLFALTMLFILWRWPKDDLTRICLVLIPIIPVEIVTRLTAHGASLWYTLLICLFLVASWSKRASALGRAGLQIGVVLALLFFNCDIIAYFAGRIDGQIQDMKRPKPEQMLSGQVFVDCAAARYYFDYRIPKDCIDFYFCLPFPNVTSLQGIAQPTDRYLVGPDNLDFLKDNGGLSWPPLIKWSPVGYSRLSFYQYPRQIFLISPAQCKNQKVRPLNQNPSSS